MGQKVPGLPKEIQVRPKGKPPKISKKLSPRKIYHFKILQDSLKSGGWGRGSYPVISLPHGF